MSHPTPANRWDSLSDHLSAGVTVLVSLWLAAGVGEALISGRWPN